MTLFLVVFSIDRYLITFVYVRTKYLYSKMFLICVVTRK